MICHLFSLSLSLRAFILYPQKSTISLISINIIVVRYFHLLCWAFVELIQSEKYPSGKFSYVISLIIPWSVFFFLINFFKNIYLFIYLWLHWVFVAVHSLSLVAASGGYSSLRCMGFSLRWLLLLRSTGCRRAGFSSCGTRPQ